MSTRDIVNFIFKDLVFTHVDDKDGYHVYSCQKIAQYSNGKKDLILAFVKFTQAPPEMCRLHEVYWRYMMTRTLGADEIDPVYYNIPQQKWNLPPPEPSINPKLSFVERQDRSTSFRVPIDNSEVTLLHNISKSTKYQYSTNYHLIQALLTMNCVVKPNDDVVHL